ncbi:unnamed protein product [Linum tenue]|uniref:SCP domain-containing protein n=3 Tax=Linum tenue TaxID=586396 RepID=A0AAV0NIX2_9ROSI|nr:unnamed protein product [Linum tenue]
MASTFAAILPSLSLIMLLSLSHLQAATPPPPPHPRPPPVLPTSARDFLAAHNAARAAVGVPPLTWSPKLSAAAVRTARLQARCQFANLTGSQYGANQMWSSGGGAAAPAPRAVVGKWVAEGKYYDHRSNTCASGHMCGVYTQVVWRKSGQLGCGSATCVKDKASLTICFYDPPGNYVGESPY